MLEAIVNMKLHRTVSTSVEHSSAIETGCFIRQAFIA